MAWTLFSVDDHTLAGTAQALARAFQDDPFFRFVAIDERALRRWLPVAQEENLRITLPEGHTYGLRGPEGEVVGGMCLLPPGTFPTPAGRTFRFLWQLITRPDPWTPSPMRALRRGAPYLEAWEAMHVHDPHWYLYNLGVVPEHRGRGGGRRLLEQALTLAAADGHPTYLETQAERSLGFYRRMGFHIVDRRTPHPQGPPTWGLLREA